ncbi:MAG: hypothetical protein KDE58_15355 [Caldilineaceae bacterium]|nr:hypothetical protein [Caldilineaceae bacterium]
MSLKGLYRVGLLCAILSTVGWLTYIYGSISASSFGLSDSPADLIVRIDHTQLRFYDLLYGWGGVLGALATIPYIIAFSYAARDAGAILVVPAVLAVIGAGLTAYAFLSGALNAHYVYATTLRELNGAEQLAYATAVAAALDSVEAVWFFASFLAYGLGMGWFALLALQSAAIPRWLSWIGVVGGVTGVSWLFLFIPIPYVVLLRMVNIVVLIVWSIGMGVVTAHIDDMPAERSVLRAATI